MAFDYVVTLQLEGRRCVVLGGGPLAAERVEGLLRSRAQVTVVAADPVAGVVVDGVDHVPRVGRPEDLDGAFLAIATREDDVDVTALWDASRAGGVLFAALDDVPHCDFGAVSTIRRGALTMTISSAGRAPALAKRLRRQLEQQYGDAHGRLVEVLHEARTGLLPRTVPFDVWAGRWEAALEDVDRLVGLVATGDEDAVVEHVRDHVDPARLAAADDGAVRPDTRTAP